MLSSEYLILFECLEAVFGSMMSNSWLCEQIHGMMRHGLRSAIGIMQANHQRMYATRIDYGLKEEQRRLLTAMEEYHRQKKRE